MIRNVSFKVAPGRMLGIVGPSGSGKTTLVRLIVGSLAPTLGHVRLDGAEMASWSAADRSRYVGYLPQNVELFEGTVRDNIARLAEVSDDAVVAAAQFAGVHRAILELPHGYGTRIGPGGLPVSGGQRQRIALARAVFGDPALVVLDEPNAYLDGDGERALIRALDGLRERGATVVLVAHRAPVMVQADWILVVRDGTVAMSGPGDEVLDRLQAPGQPRNLEPGHDE